MTALAEILTNAGQDVTPVRGGWRVRRSDGTMRTVLRRQDIDHERYAVFSASSTDALREPPLGYAGSWGSVDDAIAWAREAS